MARVNVLGLNMPEAMQGRIIAAARGVYPELTEGLSDARAIQSLLKFWTTELLATWESRQAAPDDADAARDAIEKATSARRDAAKQARAAAEDIETTAP